MTTECKLDKWLSDDIGFVSKDDQPEHHRWRDIACVVCFPNQFKRPNPAAIPRWYCIFHEFDRCETEYVTPSRRHVHLQYTAAWEPVHLPAGRVYRHQYRLADVIANVGITEEMRKESKDRFDRAKEAQLAHEKGRQ